jgi:hypothetical protein
MGFWFGLFIYLYAVDLEIALAESEEEKGNLQLRMLELEETAANEVVPHLLTVLYLRRLNSVPNGVRLAWLPVKEVADNHSISFFPVKLRY